MHHIQKHILKTLMYTKRARFSEMRPPKVDSNAYSYHLKALQKDKFVEKTEKGYRLSPGGLSYVDKISIEKFETRVQPKLTHMLVIKNHSGQLLLISKSKQPFIGSWMLPYGKLHMEDSSFMTAAIREADEKLRFIPNNLTQQGNVYIRAFINGELVSSIVANIFTGFASRSVPIGDDARWFHLSELKELNLAPAVAEIIDAIDQSDGIFFRQFDIDW